MSISMWRSWKWECKDSLLPLHSNPQDCLSGGLLGLVCRNRIGISVSVMQCLNIYCVTGVKQRVRTLKTKKSHIEWEVSAKHCGRRELCETLLSSQRLRSTKSKTARHKSLFLTAAGLLCRGQDTHWKGNLHHGHHTLCSL